MCIHRKLIGEFRCGLSTLLLMVAFGSVNCQIVGGKYLFPFVRLKSSGFFFQQFQHDLWDSKTVDKNEPRVIAQHLPANKDTVTSSLLCILTNEFVCPCCSFVWSMDSHSNSTTNIQSTESTSIHLY